MSQHSKRQRQRQRQRWASACGLTVPTPVVPRPGRTKAPSGMLNDQPESGSRPGEPQRRAQLRAWHGMNGTGHAWPFKCLAPSARRASLNRVPPPHNRLGVLLKLVPSSAHRAPVTSKLRYRPAMLGEAPRRRQSRFRSVHAADGPRAESPRASPDVHVLLLILAVRGDRAVDRCDWRDRQLPGKLCCAPSARA